MANVQNYASVWMMYLARLIQFDDVKLDGDNPKALLLSPRASGVFLSGRDVRDEPFLGVPSSMVPYFTEVDWVEASICRSRGYLFLEARDTKTQMLNIAFGIKFRKSRLDVFCIEGKEDIEDMRLNIKVFEQDPKNPLEVTFTDQHEMVNITLKEISDTIELSSEYDAQDWRSMVENTGIKRSYTTKRLVK